MKSKSKKIIGFIAFGAVSVIVLGVALAYLRYERWQRESQAAWARSDAAEKAALAMYRRDLPIGTPRAEVDRYFVSKNIAHFTLPGERPTDGGSYEVRLPDEPGDGLVCNRWTVSISFEFKVALPDDTLREIHIKRIGTCL